MLSEQPVGTFLSDAQSVNGGLNHASQVNLGHQPQQAAPSTLGDQVIASTAQEAQQSMVVDEGSSAPTVPATQVAAPIFQSPDQVISGLGQIAEEVKEVSAGNAAAQSTEFGQVSQTQQQTITQDYNDAEMQASST